MNPFIVLSTLSLLGPASADCKTCALTFYKIACRNEIGDCRPARISSIHFWGKTACCDNAAYPHVTCTKECQERPPKSGGRSQAKPT
ncbi:hypothetical protein CLAFUW4_20086 [Fulvia fulva]|uniref:uncharacterized protein n=1 Tax=Passalora fulva TaxID=5499 RepID=UPI0028527A1E|nr:uncharacterized protein CLAFUR5_20086 [Fulvia fulva]KAK4615424.1 hypothetical protein CLAFUR4_20086 [Fulvia fulva]KAK4616918.1 hypothetical protein CLAFUR0_20086 [Fulvia fulva]WMI39036.1 hypothetical protein CLAFUR5_20086 [Fulvia fulva]WPV18761.1 hypothetical protein CLAFUW4_20086 [Fulvia fulva]